jgi:hypothetical protein
VVNEHQKRCLARVFSVLRLKIAPADAEDFGCVTRQECLESLGIVFMDETVEQGPIWQAFFGQRSILDRLSHHQEVTL